MLAVELMVIFPAPEFCAQSPAKIMPLPEAPIWPAWVIEMSPPRVWPRMPMPPPPAMVPVELSVMVTAPPP